MDLSFPGKSVSKSYFIQNKNHRGFRVEVPCGFYFLFGEIFLISKGSLILLR